MSEQKLTVNQIEKVLLEKAQKEFCAKLNAELDRFSQNIADLLPSMPYKAEQETVEWLKARVKLQPGIWGQPTYLYDSISPSDLPNAISQALLNTAVDEFVQSVENAKSQVDELYNTIGC